MKRSRRTAGQISVQVKGKNLTVTPALHDQVVSKMSKLDRYHDRLTDIQVELCTEKTRDSAHHNQVEATAHVLGRTVRVTTAGSEMYAAIDEAVDKLYRQLNRRKERLKAHHNGKPSGAVEPGPESLELETLPEDEERDTIVRIKRFVVKPQFEDEALAEMEELGHSFYVFLNARTELVNVLYRRSDGAFGLIEPVV